MGSGLQVHRPARSARWASLAIVALAVVLLHLRLLSVVEWRAAADPAPRPAIAQRSLETRILAAPAPAPATAASRIEPQPPMSEPQRVAAPIERSAVPRRRPAAPAAAVTRAQPQPQPEIEAAAAASPAPRAEPAHPLYRTAVAPSTQLRFRVERGDRIGSAELTWQVRDAAYEARLDIVYEGAQRPALRSVTRVSQGRIDGAGIAPERHTERRPRGGVQAVNFERDAGEVSFSGPSWRLALEPGTQDALSWMLQLAAVAQAEPERARSGGEIVLMVVGIRGEARPWRFRYEGAEPLQVGAAVVPADKWVRETTEPYEARIEVWLDPAHHHLPARLRSGPLEMVRIE